jgi:SAM-dependent methyltransferase
MREYPEVLCPGLTALDERNRRPHCIHTIGPLSPMTEDGLCMNKIAVRLIRCPVCKSAKHDAVYEVDFRVWIKNRMFIWPAQQVACRDCGMIYANPQPMRRSLENLYESDMNYQSDDALRYFRRQQMEFIRGHTSGNSRSIFDIGASDGVFLDIAKNEGYVVSGIEPSETSVREVMDRCGIRIVRGFFDKKFVDSCNTRYDVVTLRHVLEHIQNPVGFLKLAVRITVPKKYIFIEVPDSSRPFAGNIADFFSNQHIMYYTEQSLRNIASLLRLPVVAFEKSEEIPVIRLLLRNEISQSAHW